MVGNRSKCRELELIGKLLIAIVVVASMLVVAEASSQQEHGANNGTQTAQSHRRRIHSDYKHVWPPMKFGWRIVVGAIIGFLGAAFGSAGGVGGGGIYVPMLTLIIGFDPKSSTAISKCMITGAAASTVYYNLKLRHPTLEMPVIDYDLALLFQPMLVLGVSVGVAFNVLFAEWMITILLIILFLFVSSKAFLKGVETWKKETIAKQEATRRLQSNGANGEEMISIPNDRESTDGPSGKDLKRDEVPILENVYWKEFGLLVTVWVMILALQIFKNYTTSCSVSYWLLNLAQIPVAGGVSAYQAISLYKGRRRIQSKGDAEIKWKVHALVFYCFCGLFAGIIAGLLGLGGGFILGPLFLEMGIPPQVSSATATFAMTFSASMSVVEYYLLKRFPVPYALYLVAVATIAGFVGQHVVKKMIDILGRASIIIFILSLTIFVSALTMGGVGLDHMVKKIQRKEYMGFDSICQ